MRRAQSEPIPRAFEGERGFVYATGPSLTPEVLERTHACPGWRHVAISDYYRTGYPCDLLYACDDRWWTVHYKDGKLKDYQGSALGLWCTERRTKERFPEVHWITGKGGPGLSKSQDVIHYGGNSGYQIINIAYLLGLRYLVLVGFNMMVLPSGDAKNPLRHFFGDHPQGLSRNNTYQSFAQAYRTIRPESYGIQIVNATHPTKLDAFPCMSLDDAIAQAPD